MSEWIKMFITFIMSSAFIGFIQYLITRSDSKKEKAEKKAEHTEEIEERIQEVDEARKEDYETLRAMLKSIAETVEKQQEIDGYQNDLILALTQSELFHRTAKYQRRGAITIDELAVIEDIYVPYHVKLGGNGRGKAGVEMCKTLPIISAEEAYLLDKEGKKYVKQIV